jgi:tRNA-specific 2-thiouridylase
VTHIDPDANTVTLGPREDLMKQTLVAHQINLICDDEIGEERPATGKVRYKDPGDPCLVWQTGGDELRVAFREPKRAMTPGQSVVLYDGDDVLGGGWIHHVDEPVGEEPSRYEVVNGPTR